MQRGCPSAGLRRLQHQGQECSAGHTPGLHQLHPCAHPHGVLHLQHSLRSCHRQQEQKRLPGHRVGQLQVQVQAAALTQAQGGLLLGARPGRLAGAAAGCQRSAGTSATGDSSESGIPSPKRACRANEHSHITDCLPCRGARLRAGQPPCWSQHASQSMPEAAGPSPDPAAQSVQHTGQHAELLLLEAGHWLEVPADPLPAVQPTGSEQV
jgi:hypothetical protein